MMPVYFFRKTRFLAFPNVKMQFYRYPSFSGIVRPPGVGSSHSDDFVVPSRSSSPISLSISNDRNDPEKTERTEETSRVRAPPTRIRAETAAGAVAIAGKISDNATRSSVWPSFVPRRDVIPFANYSPAGR